MDVLWLDIEYSKDHMYGVWERGSFPEPEKLTGALDEQARKLVIIMDPHLKVSNDYFLYREARYLDDREFEKWLDCYADDVVYWMPSWDDRDKQVENPQREISLIYYANRGGLEDRVFRIKTGRSSATSLPEPRQSHNLSDIEVLGRDGDTVHVDVADGGAELDIAAR